MLHNAVVVFKIKCDVYAKSYKILHIEEPK